MDDTEWMCALAWRRQTNERTNKKEIEKSAVDSIRMLASAAAFDTQLFVCVRAPCARVSAFIAALPRPKLSSQSKNVEKLEFLCLRRWILFDCFNLLFFNYTKKKRVEHFLVNCSFASVEHRETRKFLSQFCFITFYFCWHFCSVSSSLCARRRTQKITISRTKTNLRYVQNKMQ